MVVGRVRPCLLGSVGKGYYPINIGPIVRIAGGYIVHVKKKATNAPSCKALDCGAFPVKMRCISPNCAELWCISPNCGAFRRIVVHFAELWCISPNCGAFRRIVVHFAELWCISPNCGAFRRIVVHFAELWRVQ